MDNENGFQILGSLGLKLDLEVSGMLIVGAKPAINTAGNNLEKVNILSLQSPDGKVKKTVYCGNKSVEEGAVTRNDKGEPVIANGFDTTVIRGSAWIRNKKNAGANALPVLS